MTKVRTLFALLAVVTGVAFALGGPAGAIRFGGGAPLGRDGGNHGGLPNGPPNFQCLKSCRDLNGLCLLKARTDEQTCAQLNCGDESQAVQAACSGAEGSAACISARNVLRTCVQQDCGANFQTEIANCLSSGQTCSAGCSNPAPGQPDPQCVAGCNATLQICRLNAESGQPDCFANCTPLITTAQQTCDTDPSASACRAALRAAQMCVQQTEQSAQRSCLQAEQGCVAACPTTTRSSTPPTPTATPGP